ncbi:hypothetical protein [Streptomyces sp. Inha503]|uniref:hypothetical protein n=1 Tax=Streptomyces sp. Inha503 TaxID=3383314 RepID=UPI00399F6B6E
MIGLWRRETPAPAQPIVANPAARHRNVTVKDCTEDYAIGQSQRADAARRAQQGGPSA